GASSRARGAARADAPPHNAPRPGSTGAGDPRRRVRSARGRRAHDWRRRAPPPRGRAESPAPDRLLLRRAERDPPGPIRPDATTVRLAGTSAMAHPISRARQRAARFAAARFAAAPFGTVPFGQERCNVVCDRAQSMRWYLSACCKGAPHRPLRGLSYIDANGAPFDGRPPCSPVAAKTPEASGRRHMSLLDSEL